MLSRRMLPVTLFTLAYLAAGGTIAVLNWNKEFIFYGIVLVLQVWQRRGPRSRM